MTQFVAKLHALENVHVSFPKWELKYLGGRGRGRIPHGDFIHVILHTHIYVLDPPICL